MSVEKIGDEANSSAYRIRLGMPDGSVKDEVVHLTNEEQVADLGLRYAEVITSAAAEPEPAVA